MNGGGGRAAADVWIRVFGDESTLTPRQYLPRESAVQTTSLIGMHTAVLRRLFARRHCRERDPEEGQKAPRKSCGPVGPDLKKAKASGGKDGGKQANGRFKSPSH